MKQGRADRSGSASQKSEPNPKFVNPGAVSYLGEHLGNHSTDGGDFALKSTPWDAGRGYSAPAIGSKRHKSGSQGSY